VREVQSEAASALRYPPFMDCQGVGLRKPDDVPLVGGYLGV
jgi:hypothetical protein